LIYSPLIVLAAALNSHRSGATRRFGEWLCLSLRPVCEMCANGHVNYVQHV